MTSFPKISIVTPSFNQGRFIEKTILSVIEQDYPNLEYIIIDGGSTDESVEIIRKYEKQLAYWVSEPDRGQSHAINKGFEHATGEIFGWLNSDDWYHPGALKAVAEAFAANPEAGAVVGAGKMVDEKGNSLVMEPYDISVESLYNWMDKFFMQPSCLFRAEAWKECGPLNENIHFAMDLDLWIRIATKFRYLSISKLLSSSLIHSDAKTTASAAASMIDAASVIIAHGGVEIAKTKLEIIINELLVVRPLLPKLNQQIGELEKQLQERDRQLQEREKQIKALHNSYSWKITKPLRDILSFINK